MPQADGGLGPDLKLPLLADKSHKITRDYGVLLEDEGIALRGLFIIDPSGKLRFVFSLQLVSWVGEALRKPPHSRQSTINDLPVGRSVDETLRLIQAFQFVVRARHWIHWSILDNR